MHLLDPMWHPDLTEQVAAFGPEFLCLIHITTGLGDAAEVAELVGLSFETAELAVDFERFADEFLGIVEVAAGQGDGTEVAEFAGLSFESAEIALDIESFAVKLLGVVEVAAGPGDEAEAAEGGGLPALIVRSELEQVFVLAFGGGQVAAEAVDVAEAVCNVEVVG